MHTYEDYTPKYHIGDAVTANQACTNERESVVTGRTVYRSRAKGPNTYYNLADGTGAWEASLSLTTERIAPELAAARIVRSFDIAGVLAESVATTKRHADGSHSTEIRLLMNRTYVYFRAFSGDREVTTTAQWQIAIGPEEPTWEPNLGSAIVSVYNATLGTVGATTTEGI